jgi:hypothetical protein
MIEMTEGWASLSLHSPADDSTPNPPHVAVSVPCVASGDAAAIRAAAIAAALRALDEARAALEAAR